MKQASSTFIQTSAPGPETPTLIFAFLVNSFARFAKIWGNNIRLSPLTSPKWAEIPPVFSLVSNLELNMIVWRFIFIISVS